jgi:hypothetical protein
LACAALPNAKRFSPGLATATFPAAAAFTGTIVLTDAIPKAWSSVRRSMLDIARILQLKKTGSQQAVNSAFHWSS